MIDGIGDAIGNMIIWSIIIAFLAGVVVTLACVYGLPYLWEMIRPWLHTVTA